MKGTLEDILANMPAGLRLRNESKLRGETRTAPVKAVQDQDDISEPARKYKNQPQVLDGFHFDSKLEAARYLHLKNLQALKTISGLQPQFPYTLLVNGIDCGTYLADFQYTLVETGEVVIEDVKGGKGTATALYKLKKKIMAASGYRVREIHRALRPAGWDDGGK